MIKLVKDNQVAECMTFLFLEREGVEVEDYDEIIALVSVSYAWNEEVDSWGYERSYRIYLGLEIDGFRSSGASISMTDVEKIRDEVMKELPKYMRFE